MCDLFSYAYSSLSWTHRALCIIIIAMKDILLGTLFITLANTIIWFATNAQFFNKWASDHKIIIAILSGIPISVLSVISAKYFYAGFSEQVWPGRFLSYAVGTIIMMFFANYFLDEGINLKTSLCLILSLAIIFVQIFM